MNKRGINTENMGGVYQIFGDCRKSMGIVLSFFGEFMEVVSGSIQRHTWIDALRLFAGLSMVGLHTTADFAGQPFPGASPEERVAPMILRAVLYTARTELFLMVTVFLLLMALDRRPRGYRETIRQQARRLLVPFLFWATFFAFYGLIKARAFGYLAGEFARVSDPFSWIGFLLLGDVKYHMHFIPTLFALLLFFPMFRLAERRPIWGVLVFVFLLLKRELDGLIYPHFWGTEALPYFVRLVKVTTYVGYGLAAGALLGIWRRIEAEERTTWVPLLLLSSCFLCAFKLVSTLHVVQSGAWDFDYDPGFWADFLMPLMLLAICMCLAERAWPAWISKVSKYSFGIYLCHPIFLDIAEIALREQTLAPIWFVLAKLAWTLPMTCAFVFILSKIPAFAWTIGLGSLPRILPRLSHLAHLK